MPENIFEYAAMHKLRFNYKGQLTTEDLYDLSLKELDSIYKTLNRENKKEEEESLLVTHTTKDTALAVKIEIIKYIVRKKQEQEEKAKKAAEKFRDSVLRRPLLRSAMITCRT